MRGGTNGDFGTVFRISNRGRLTSLYSFTGGGEGESPDGGLVQGNDGNFYGTTFKGGTNAGYKPGYGTFFKITTNGTLTALHFFDFNGGCGPMAALMQGRDGRFYGTTSLGGSNGAGTVFRISPSGTFVRLYSFTGKDDGGGPRCALVQGRDDNIYGTACKSGVVPCEGTFFRLTVTSRAAPVIQSYVAANAMFTLAWSTEPEGMYQVQYNADLSPTNWLNLGGVITASGATFHITTSFTTLERFYRVVLVPEP
jgi:uncharacterized repeat protein (TIGR03803 family)